ncbi:MAG: hypothetical protein ACREVL_10450 [Solimonas sp.]
MNIDEVMNSFRVASISLFNVHFRIPDPYNNDGWALEERFSEVQKLLFQKMVIEPAGLREGEYGHPQNEIAVEERYLSQAQGALSIMLNRELTSGYWDHPVSTVPAACRLVFVSYFDWDQLGFRDHHYVRVQISDWPEHPEMKGKHGLVDADKIIFRLAK